MGSRVPTSREKLLRFVAKDNTEIRIFPHSLAQLAKVTRTSQSAAACPKVRPFLGKLRSARCAVPLLSPVSRQTVAQDAPLFRSVAILRASTITRGLPSRLPFARAAAKPDRTLDRISSRSNSAIEAKMPNTSRPLGVEVSTPS